MAAAGRDVGVASASCGNDFTLEVKGSRGLFELQVIMWCFQFKAEVG
jgi:hypothetical protein